MKRLEWPPVYALGAALLMWVLARHAPGAFIIPERLRPWGLGLVLAAFGLMIWAFIELRRRRTTVIPRRAPSALATGGPYRFSRNPIYLADALALAGWGVMLGALTPFFMAPLFMKVVAARFIRDEEAGLLRAFPEEAAAWMRKARRWI